MPLIGVVWNYRHLHNGYYFQKQTL